MIREVLFGVAVGDALGVPGEFQERELLSRHPVVGMIGGGKHKQEPGTFSDDSSLSFCQAEALIGEYSLRRLADNFIAWQQKAFWTAHGEVFDEGSGTREAIGRLISGVDPVLAGGMDHLNNGNGSLMRILPLLFYINDKPVAARFRHIKESSSLTHGHIRSVICCFYYLEYARILASGTDKFEAYSQVNYEANKFLEYLDSNPIELALLNRLWNGDIHTLDVSSIRSTGYVLDSLEAGIWCLLTTGSYEEAVLKAVNLGNDTDTTAAITGGLAGLLYGFENIPEKWLALLARRSDIEDLAKRVSASYPNLK